MARFGLNEKQWALLEVGSAFALVATLSRQLAGELDMDWANFGLSRDTWKYLTTGSLGVAMVFALKSSVDAMEAYQYRKFLSEIDERLGLSGVNHFQRAQQLQRSVK